jgi:hypothetical protein
MRSLTCLTVALGFMTLIPSKAFSQQVSPTPLSPTLLDSTGVTNQVNSNPGVTGNLNGTIYAPYSNIIVPPSPTVSPYGQQTVPYDQSFGYPGVITTETYPIYSYPVYSYPVYPGNYGQQYGYHQYGNYGRYPDYHQRGNYPQQHSCSAIVPGSPIASPVPLCH